MRKNNPMRISSHNSSCCENQSFHIWVVYVKLAYLQYDMPLKRKIFITNPASVFEISPIEFLELLKQFYGLADSGYECYRASDDHVQIDLKMIPTLIDPSLYC